jgi:hypothetical protein
MPESDTYSAEQLSSLPARHGFRQHGTEVTRRESRDFHSIDNNSVNDLPRDKNSDE